MSMHETFSSGNYGNDAVVGQVLDHGSVSVIEEAKINVADELKFLNVDWFAAWGERYVTLNHSNTPVFLYFSAKYCGQNVRRLSLCVGKSMQVSVSFH